VARVLPGKPRIPPGILREMGESLSREVLGALRRDYEPLGEPPAGASYRFSLGGGGEEGEIVEVAYPLEKIEVSGGNYAKILRYLSGELEELVKRLIWGEGGES
jgi:hypothetical protein